MRVRFKGMVNFPAYHSHQTDFVDGEEKDVPDEIGEYLLETFPAHFEVVKAKAIDEPVKHRMITGESKTKKKGKK